MSWRFLCLNLLNAGITGLRHRDWLILLRSDAFVFYRLWWVSNSFSTVSVHTLNSKGAFSGNWGMGSPIFLGLLAAFPSVTFNSETQVHSSSPNSKLPVHELELEPYEKVLKCQLHRGLKNLLFHLKYTSTLSSKNKKSFLLEMLVAADSIVFIGLSMPLKL